MNHETDGRNRAETVRLYPGIHISFYSLTAETESFPIDDGHSEQILEINYCRAGRIGWIRKNGSSVYLGPKDFSLHTMQAYADSRRTLPNGFYDGMTLRINLQELANHPPEPLEDAEVIGTLLYEKFCRSASFPSFAGNRATETIFSFFYNQPPALQLSYQKIKILELLLYLCRPDHITERRLTEYQSEQVEIVHKIHEQLARSLDQRVTIEALSKQYLMNPTTLKAVFKSVYGNSIAAHMKEHRMEEAARLLAETDRSIAEIALAVGYDSQSKFSAAFKDCFHMLPKEYRRKR